VIGRTFKEDSERYADEQRARKATEGLFTGIFSHGREEDVGMGGLLGHISADDLEFKRTYGYWPHQDSPAEKEAKTRRVLIDPKITHQFVLNVSIYHRWTEAKTPNRKSPRFQWRRATDGRLLSVETSCVLEQFRLAGYGQKCNDG
jgi:hypothetical protein